MGEVTTRQFCFEIYWPLPVTTLFFSFLPICISNWFSIYFFAEFMLNGALLDFLRKEDGKGKVTFDNLISISGQVWNFFQIFLYMMSLIILSNCVNSRQIKSIPTLFTEDMYKIIQIKWNQSSSKVYHKLRRFSSLRLFVRAWFQNHLSPPLAQNPSNNYFTNSSLALTISIIFLLHVNNNFS